MKFLFRSVGIVAVLLIGVVPARATMINAGGTLSPLPGGGSSTFTIPSNSTIVANNTMTYKFTSGGTIFIGILREEVVRLSSGKLDFLYQFTNTGSTPPNNPNGPSSFKLMSFNGVSTDVIQAQNVSGRGVTFGTGKTEITSATRDSGPGTGITFDLGSALNSHDSPTYTIVVATNTTTFDSKGSVTAPGFGGKLTGIFGALPAPEPATMVLWLGAFGGLGLVGVIRARRKKAAPTVV